MRTSQQQHGSNRATTAIRDQCPASTAALHTCLLLGTPRTWCIMSLTSFTRQPRLTVSSSVCPVPITRTEMRSPPTVVRCTSGSAHTRTMQANTRHKGMCQKENKPRTPPHRNTVTPCTQRTAGVVMHAISEHSEAPPRKVNSGTDPTTRNRSSVGSGEGTQSCDTQWAGSV